MPSLLLKFGRKLHNARESIIIIFFCVILKFQYTIFVEKRFFGKQDILRNILDFS